MPSVCLDGGIATAAGAEAKPSTPRSILRREAPARSPTEGTATRKTVTFEVRQHQLEYTRPYFLRLLFSSMHSKSIKLRIFHLNETWDSNLQSSILIPSIEYQPLNWSNSHLTYSK